MSEPLILKLKGKTLFDEPNGKATGITLTKNPENFKRLKITIFRGNSINAGDGGYGRKTIEIDISPLAKGQTNEIHPSFFIIDNDGGNVLFYTCRAKITKGSKTIELENNNRRIYISGSNVMNEEFNPSIAICKIVGYEN